MSETPLRKILLLCHSMEDAAASFYAGISRQAQSEEQRAFWADISRDEERHTGYWGDLLDLEREGKLRDPFEEPEKIQAELESLREKIDEALRDHIEVTDLSCSLLWAFRLESMMLHPAFAVLFSLLDTDGEGPSPFDDYREHLNKFHDLVGKYCKGKPAMELLGQILPVMWDRNAEMARHFAHIRTLRGFLPICSNCKKIRDDQGYWNQVESYIHNHSEATFSHSMCPDCAIKVYQEMSKKRKS